MIDPSSTHLSDVQFTGLLLGDIPQDVREHLAICDECTREAEKVSAAIGSFEHESRVWAENRVASRPAFQPRQHLLPWSHSPRVWAVSAAATAILLLAGTESLRYTEHSVSSTPSEMTRTSTAEVAPSTLRSDNELLSAIDGELRWTDPSPSTIYGKKSETHADPDRVLKRTSN